MAEGVKDFYDQLAGSYHLIFEDWEVSIRRQAAILGAILERECGTPARVKVLDCACGIGTQALGLAKLGFQVTACDLSPSAVERTRMEADKRGLSVRTFAADMLNLTEVPDGEFDAVICMDNALPHLESEQQLFQAVTQMRRKLRLGALFMASIRDYDSLVREKPMVQGPNFYSGEEGRRIVHQVWDWLDDRRYTFHLYITREIQDEWESQHYVSNYRSIMRDELSEILARSGFSGCRWIRADESGFYQPIVLAKAKSTTL
ncbi:MAG: class I SAM-dependent methyltransferase [Acidobacteriia bacterium]|nr:class I SAM-dependent methyltransferase [Terriglobia bacterium]